MLPDEDPATIGLRLRQIRQSRQKSLRTIAGLAGISPAHLSQIELGHQPIYSLRQLVNLSEALGIAPSEITKLPVPAPANGHTDAATENIRLIFDAIGAGRPGGTVVPLPELTDAVIQAHQWRRECRFADVAAVLPQLIRNVHTTLKTGQHRNELLDLAVYLHVHLTRLWLSHAGAPTDLVRRCVFLAKQLAEERNHPVTLTVATFGIVDVLLTGGAFNLGKEELESITMPPTKPETAGLIGYITAAHAVTAALDGRPGDVQAPLDSSEEIATKFQDSAPLNTLGLVYTPTDAGVYRMWLSLENDDPDTAMATAQRVDPVQHPFHTIRANYWVTYGRALTKIRGKRDDAVLAFRTAEELFPTRVRRDPFVRDSLSCMVEHSKRDAVGRELRGMAYRAGLTV